MNKAGKHIQSGGGGGGSGIGIGMGMGSPIGIGNNVLTTSLPNNNNASANANISSPGQAAQKNVFNSIMSFLPDNRPITSLQIVEDYEKCPKNFTPVHRTYDQDSDADLWRENNILFGRQTTRYLCLSKTEGLPEYVVETLKVIAEKIQPPKEFSLLSRTADSEQKAWRKRQIAYKLSKRGTVTQAVTDIILCAKLKIAPEGFKLAGDINGVLVCFKTGAIPVRLPPPVPLAGMQSPQQVNGGSEVEKALNRLNLSGGSTAISWSPHQPLPPVPNDVEHDYEEIEGGFHLSSPRRPAPPRPPPHGPITSTATNTSLQSVGTLGSYTELDGVPFVVNPALRLATQNELFKLPQHISAEMLKTLDYDFQMERQILCTMKSSASKNPFFK